MARPTTTQLNTPSDRKGTTYGPRQQGATQSAQVFAPLNVQTGPSSAEQFARALGLVNETVTPIIKKSVADKAREETIQGIEAVLTGNADPAQQDNPYYRRGFETAYAKRDVVEAKQQWSELVQKEGLLELPPAEYAKRQDAFMRERFDYLQNSAAGREAVIDDILQWQAQSIAKHGEYLREKQDNEYIDNSGVNLGAAYDADPASLAAAAKATHDEHYGVLGGTRANETIVAQMGALAVAKGDPSILDSVPERAKSVPRLGRQIEQYRREAQAARDGKLADETREREEARAEARRSSRNEIASQIVDGKSGPALRQAKELLDAGVLDFEDYRALQNFHEDIANDTSTSDDGGSMAALDMEVKLRSGDASITDLMSSNLSIKEKRRLLPLAGRKDDGAARNYRSDLRLRSTPPRGLGGEVKPGDIQRQADLLAEFDELVESGVPPKEAYAQMKKGNPELFQAQQQPQQGRATAPTPEPSVGSIRQAGDGRYYKLVRLPANDRNNWEAL